MKKLLTFFCLAALLLPVLLTGCGSGGEQAASVTVRLNEVTHWPGSRGSLPMRDWRWS